MARKASAVYASITACFFLVVAGCGADESSQPSPHPKSSQVATADLDRVVKQWKHLGGYTQNLVCLQALERGGPDYLGMLRELIGARVPQSDAAAMLPYAANQCL